MVAAAGPLNRFGGGRHLWLATVPVAESPLNGGLSVANEAQPIFFFSCLLSPISRFYQLIKCGKNNAYFPLSATKDS